ncbi:MAG: contractile injection system protein, VgrG/Pvc8 family [Polyangiaceae bacterium]
MVTDFRSRIGLETTSLTLSDYDFERPALPLTASGAAAEAEPHPLGGVGLEHYEHHGEYEESDVDADNLRAGLAQIRARTTTGEGRSACRRIAPGWRSTSSSTTSRRSIFDMSCSP